jgi:hypothetical protein
MSNRRICANDTGSSNQRAMTAKQSALVKECLMLTVGQLEVGDLDRMALSGVVAHLRAALRLAHRCMEKQR